jgi:hypothetical protein
MVLEEGFDSVPMTAKEKFLQVVSYPIVTYIPMVLAMIAVQAMLPAPRIGIDALWEWQLRVVVGLVAVIPSIIGIAIQTRNREKADLSPRMSMRVVTEFAVLGSALAVFAAWSLGATLTVALGSAAFVAAVVWMWVTGVVAGYIAGNARHALVSAHMADVSYLPTKPTQAPEQARAKPRARKASSSRVA